MSSREVLCATLRTMWNLYDADVDAIVADKGFFIPYLKEAIARRVRLGCVSEEERATSIDSTDFHALLILTHLGEKDFFPDFLQLLRMNDKDLHLLYSNTLTEDLWWVVARTADNHWDKIWKFMQDDRLESVALSPIFSGVAALPHIQPEKRNEAIQFVKKIVEHRELFDCQEIAGLLVDCGDNALSELRETALSFASTFNPEDGEWLVLADAEDVVDAFDGERSAWQAERLKTTIHSIYAFWRRSEEKAKAEREAERKREAWRAAKELKESQYYPSKSPKVGRNDPCPCGSGKKYKKCCGK